MVTGDLQPGAAEIRAQNLKSLLANPVFDEVFVKLIDEGIEEAKRVICKATKTEELFKAAGQLKAYHVLKISIDELVGLGERKKRQRLAKVTKEATKDDR